MTKKKEVLDLVKQQGLLPLFYSDSLYISRQVVQALYNGGVRVFEYTNRGQYALANFKELRKFVSSELKDMHLGVGTVKSNEDAQKFIDAGADFVVCPIVNPEVAATVHKNGLLWIPGCFTNTEIYAAETAGATLLKIFPGSLAGPGYINAIRDIFSNLDFMPTGGVEPTKANIQAWFTSGVVAVGMGSKMVVPEFLEQMRYIELTILTQKVFGYIQEARR
jgi:2-dehydro-3-deoxyphosphogluconate aldolase/(4S)-4-hydroxy-2-oxoglutarate aldolase